MHLSQQKHKPKKKFKEDLMNTIGKLDLVYGYRKLYSMIIEFKLFSNL